jgi:hypothetical protein
MKNTTNTIYLKRSTTTNMVRWAVVSPQGSTINKGEYRIKKLHDIVHVVKYLKEKYNTTTAYQLLTLE